MMKSESSFRISDPINPVCTGKLLKVIDFDLDEVTRHLKFERGKLYFQSDNIITGLSRTLIPQEMDIEQIG